MKFRMTLLAILAVAIVCGFGSAARARDIIDAMERTVAVPDTVSRAICSGFGTLRLLVYLQAQDRVVGVDDKERKKQKFEARPYAIANPQFKTLPILGEYRGFDHPERILALSPAPQVIFKSVVSGSGVDPVELQEKTEIPIVTLDYGDLGVNRDRFNRALRTMGEVLGLQERAEAVIAFFGKRIADLRERAARADTTTPVSAYVGGVSHRGPHGLQSTEPGYPPFLFVGVKNIATDGENVTEDMAHADVSKEMIVTWDPHYLFLDLNTLRLGDARGGLADLQSDPVYRTLSAVRERRVYGVLPYNSYAQNFGSVLANAYFIGKVVHPAAFQDIDPAAEADAIYEFLVGKRLFGTIDGIFANLVYKPIPLN